MGQEIIEPLTSWLDFSAELLCRQLTPGPARYGVRQCPLVSYTRVRRSFKSRLATSGTFVLRRRYRGSSLSLGGRHSGHSQVSPDR